MGGSTGLQNKTAQEMRTMAESVLGMKLTPEKTRELTRRRS